MTRSAPTSRPGNWRHSLVWRSVLVVVLASALAAAGAIGYTALSTSQRAHEASNQRITELLDTVESSVKVASFAQDQTLAGELAQGLLSNSNVLAVTIFSDEQVLSHVQRTPGREPVGAGLERVIYSPFDSRIQVGLIRLHPDPQSIQDHIAQEVKAAAVQLAWQLAMVAFAGAAIMLLFIVGPIKAISDRLHSMDPTAGERLPMPQSLARTEIGLLVQDINHLSDRLVDTLAQERALLRQRDIDEKKYHAIFNNAETGIFVADPSGEVTSWNPAFARLLALGAPSEAIGPTELSVLKAHLPELSGLISAAMRDDHPVSHEILLQGANVAPRWLSLVLSPVGEGLLQGVVHDVTELKESEAAAKRLLVTDALTGLANRAGLLERLAQQLQRLEAGKTPGFALLLLNLDEFKRINQGLGLPAGDDILKATATRLTSAVKPEDTLARLTGDVFGLLLDHVTQGERADHIAGRLLATIRRTFHVDGAPVRLNASVGITLVSDPHADALALVHQAELALASAKAAGGDLSMLYDPAQALAAQERRALETDLRSALDLNQLELFYQPVIDLQHWRLSGAEALIRWRHPTRGLVAPDRFIALAERTGLIVDIGLFVAQQACRQLQMWQRAGHARTLSLNVSGRQIPDGLPPGQLQRLITEFDLVPGQLALEITEGVMLRDIDKSLAWLQAVHAIGVRVYLDDFGTGYSSLSYLKRFPIDTLKIDKSFIQDIQAQGSEHTLVRAIVAMAGSLGIDVVAEGVEQPEQMRMLRAMGCQRAQGFYFSRPVPASAFEATAARLEGLLADAAAAQPG